VREGPSGFSGAAEAECEAGEFWSKSAGKVCARPLGGPAVELAFAAVEPVDVHGDRDGRLVVLDVVTLVLAAPLVGACSTGWRSTPQVSNKCSHDGRYRRGGLAGVVPAAWQVACSVESAMAPLSPPASGAVFGAGHREFVWEPFLGTASDIAGREARNGRTSSILCGSCRRPKGVSCARES
jgi:hypothetical protein